MKLSCWVLEVNVVDRALLNTSLFPSMHNNDFSGNTILKNTLEKVHGEFDGTLKETEAAKE